MRFSMRIHSDMQRNRTAYAFMKKKNEWPILIPTQNYKKDKVEISDENVLEKNKI